MATAQEIQDIEELVFEKCAKIAEELGAGYGPHSLSGHFDDAKNDGFNGRAEGRCGMSQQ